MAARVVGQLIGVVTRARHSITGRRAALRRNDIGPSIRPRPVRPERVTLVEEGGRRLVAVKADPD
jgi:hypothetical protein